MNKQNSNKIVKIIVTCIIATLLSVVLSIGICTYTSNNTYKQVKEVGLTSGTTFTSEPMVHVLVKQDLFKYYIKVVTFNYNATHDITVYTFTKDKIAYIAEED